MEHPALYFAYIRLLDLQLKQLSERKNWHLTEISNMAQIEQTLSKLLVGTDEVLTTPLGKLDGRDGLLSKISSLQALFLPYIIWEETLGL